MFARRGIVPEGSSSYFLPKLVGVGRAMEWVMTGRVFPAPEAEGSGLYNYLLPEVSRLPAWRASVLLLAGDRLWPPSKVAAAVAQTEVYPKAVEIATQIAENCSPSSLSLSKFMLWKQLDGSSPEAAHLLESRLLNVCDCLHAILCARASYFCLRAHRVDVCNVCM